MRIYDYVCKRQTGPAISEWANSATTRECLARTRLCVGFEADANIIVAAYIVAIQKISLQDLSPTLTCVRDGAYTRRADTDRGGGSKLQYLTIPINPLARGVGGVRVCVTLHCGMYGYVTVFEPPPLQPIGKDKVQYAERPIHTYMFDLLWFYSATAI